MQRISALGLRDAPMRGRTPLETDLGWCSGCPGAFAWPGISGPGALSWFAFPRQIEASSRRDIPSPDFRRASVW